MPSHHETRLMRLWPTWKRMVWMCSLSLSHGFKPQTLRREVISHLWAMTWRMSSREVELLSSTNSELVSKEVKDTSKISWTLRSTDISWQQISHDTHHQYTHSPSRRRKYLLPSRRRKYLLLCSMRSSQFVWKEFWWFQRRFLSVEILISNQ